MADRKRLGRESAVLALPNGFTMANLFFGMFAIVAAARGQPDAAARYIVFSAIADMLDGRIARATNTGSRFGSELDSLVDAVSFGVAPGLIMYFVVFNRTGWDWIFCFLFTACAVIRLARFNVEQAGKAKTHFTGLPSPAAGLTLATYYWFSQTTLYTDTMLADLPWHQMLRFVMLGLGMLMISNVQYAAVPTVGFRSIRGVLGSMLVAGTLAGVIFLPKEFFFPALMAYVLFGIARTVFIGLLDRRPQESFARSGRSTGDSGRRAISKGGDSFNNEFDQSDDPADEEAGYSAPRRRRRRRPPRKDHRRSPDQQDNKE